MIVVVVVMMMLMITGEVVRRGSAVEREAMAR